MSQSQHPPPVAGVIPAGTPPVLADALRRHQAGDLDGALDRYRAHLAAVPDDAAALFSFATALANSGRMEEAVATYRRCQALAPERLEVAVNLGDVYQHLGRLDEAQAQFRRVLEAQPEDPVAMIRLANVLLAAEQAAAAIALYEAAAARGACGANQLRAMARGYLLLGRWADARAVCEPLLADNPHDAGALALRGVAQRELDWRAASLRPASGAASFMLVFPPPPEGFASSAQFNAALAAALLEYGDREFAPRDYSTRGGFQTGNLAHAGSGIFAALHQMIDGVVSRFVSGECARARDAYLSRPVRGWRLHTWGTILGESGHQDAHIHRSAWMSGVYYVQVPAAVCAEDPLRRGWIEFGHPPAQYPVQAWYALETMRPIEGMLLLFPSYLYHRTVPLAGSELRISVAFDVLLQ